jgi:hypothetical protein
MRMRFRYPDKPLRSTVEWLSDLDESEWMAQPKYDGYHMLVYFENEAFRCYSSRGRLALPASQGGYFPLTPEIMLVLSDLAKKVPNESVLGTEIVGRRGPMSPKIYLFDTYAWSSQWLCDMPFEERWGITSSVASMWTNSGLIELSHIICSGFMVYYNSLKEDWIARGGGLDLYEGIVAKSKNGTLELRQNAIFKTPKMIKVKYREGAQELRG